MGGGDQSRAGTTPKDGDLMTCKEATEHYFYCEQMGVHQEKK